MILFSSDMTHRQGELNELTTKTRKLVYLIDQWLESRFALHPCVTSMIRTEDEQRAIMQRLGEPYKPSVHQFGRGVDFRPFSDQINDLLLEWVNKQFVYDFTREEKKTLILHKGTGRHFHLQSLT